MPHGKAHGICSTPLGESIPNNSIFEVPYVQVDLQSLLTRWLHQVLGAGWQLHKAISQT